MMRLSLIILCMFTLGACQITERACPAFGSPLADEWSTALNVGDRVNFVSDRGTAVSLELTEREDSEPFTGYSRNGSDYVICRTTSDRIYKFDKNELALRIELKQTRTDIPALLAGESFTVRIQPQSPIDEPVINGPDYLFFLGIDARERYADAFDLSIVSESEPKVSRVIRNLQIGSNLYSYAIEQKFAYVTPFTDAGINPASFKAITRMIMAEGSGLVQFEMLNGEIFSRM